MRRSCSPNVQCRNRTNLPWQANATIEETKTFVQRRCQNAQLIPGTSGMQSLNQVYNYPERQQGKEPTQTNNSTRKATVTKEVKRKFGGNCRYCYFIGHRWIKCCKRLKDEANGINTKTQLPQQPEINNAQQQQTEKPRYNTKWYARFVGQ